MTTVFYNCFTSVWHGVNQLVAPFSCYSTPRFSNNIAQFIYISWFCFRNSIFNITPQVLDWIKVWGLDWPLHNINFVGLERIFGLFTSVFGVIVLLKHPFQVHVLFSIRQHDLFKYFDMCKLIHDPWYAAIINRPSWCLHHNASLSSLCAVAWIQILGVV